MAFKNKIGVHIFLDHTVLPFGLSNGPSSFQRSMDIILAGLRWTACLVYLDDVIVYASTIDLHVERLRLVLECLGKAGLKLKVSKCRFAESSLKVLGHVVDADGIRPDPEKLAAVREFPTVQRGKDGGSESEESAKLPGPVFLLSSTHKRFFNHCTPVNFVDQERRGV